MIYLSIDVETTGVNTDEDQIIEFSAIIEDTNNIKIFEEIPKFTRYVKHNKYFGEAYALHMNAHIFEILAGINKSKDHLICHESELVDQICLFLLRNGIEPNANGEFHITAAGKNLGTFDLLLAKRLPGWKQIIKIHKRLADPAILFTNWHEDVTLPDLLTCKKRACIEGKVTHDSVYDAWDVIELLRTKYGQKEVITSIPSGQNNFNLNHKNASNLIHVNTNFNITPTE